MPAIDAVLMTTPRAPSASAGPVLATAAAPMLMRLKVPIRLTSMTLPKAALSCGAPSRPTVRCAQPIGTLAAYAAILVAEEVLDVMQRDWMRDERVVPFVRTINNIHVVEESRHMKFAREETPGFTALITGICLQNRDDDARLAAGTTLLDSLYRAFQQRDRK